MYKQIGVTYSSDTYSAAVPEEEFVRNREALQALEARYTGVSYTLDGADYLVPLNSASQAGITAVTVAVMSEALDFTVMQFSNGVSMPIKAADWMPFAKWFAAQRNALFVGS
jgi:hypothetical protein